MPVIRKMILYLGNMLAIHSGSVSVIETLGPKLATQYAIRCASSKKLQLPRLYEMLSEVITNRKTLKGVLIDSYSTRAFWYTVASSLLCRYFKIPYIPILHGGSFPQKLAKSKFWTRQVFNNSYTNIAPSGYLKYFFKQAGIESIYIPNFIEIERYSFSHRKSAAPKILWVRAFHSIYNPNLAIDVLSLLSRDYPDAELCMVGPDKDGSMETFRENAKEKGIADRIIITGGLSNEKWINMSAEYDIFLNTTDIDNAPISVIEAMALGMLVVSTNAGGLPYLLQDRIDSLLVPVRNPFLMADAIKSLLKDPELCNTISSNAREKARSFSWEAVRKSWFQLLDNLISNRK